MTLCLMGPGTEAGIFGCGVPHNVALPVRAPCGVEAEMNISTVLQAGVALIGVVLLFEVIRALVTGFTYGYYRSHVYTRRDDSGSYFTWVLGRAILGGLAVSAAILLG
jgi:hypothetical protein